MEKDSKYIEFNIDCHSFCTIPISFGSNKYNFSLQLDTTTSYTSIPSTDFDLDVPKYGKSISQNGKKQIKLLKLEGIIYGKLSYDSIKLENIDFNSYSFFLLILMIKVSKIILKENLD